VFHTLIDATGGGLAPSKSYVYARFSDTGLKAVAISDEDAFSSLGWDIAVRRYVIRLNSGVSGPGDVTAARTQPKTDFDTLKSVPSELDYRTEEYFTDSCDFVSDGSGIGTPATALASFWSYQACVAMTHNVYVVALPDERHVKLEVLSYYAPDKQLTCDETGMVPMPSGAGSMRIRWAYLD
jgi:HmuY protein